MSSRLGALLLAPALLLGGCDGGQKHDAPSTTASTTALVVPSSAPASASVSASAVLPPLGLPSTVVVPETARCAKGGYFGPHKLGDELGTSVAAAGDLVVTGAPRRERDDGGLGAALVLRRSGTGCTLESEIREKGLRLGSEVATDGQVVFVDALFDGAGAVLAFEQKDGAWVKTQRLASDRGKNDDMFGMAIAVSGGTVVIGASGNAGAVYCFERSEGVWKQTQRITPELPGPGKPARIGSGAFGANLALEGETLVIAEPYASGPKRSNGSVHVYRRDGARWVAKARLQSAEPIEREELGSSIALSGDTIAALANLPERRGGVVLFGRDGEGWAQRAVIVAPADVNVFEGTVALRGRTLYLGALATDDGRGAVLQYELLDGDDYRLVRRLTLDRASTTAWFGGSLAMAGSAVVVGARFVDDRAGGVYLLPP
jgi:hypothetical protein